MAKSRTSPQPSKQPQRRLRGASRFKRSDAARLVRGAMDAGLQVKGVEVDPISGKLRVLTEPVKPEAPDVDLDRELAEWEERRGR